MARAIEQIYTLRAKLCFNLSKYCGIDLQGLALTDFIRDLRASLPAGMPENAVKHTAATLSKRTLDYPTLYEFSWRLAGNVSRLKDGETILPWDAQPALELMPVQVLEYHKDRFTNGAPAAKYTLRILAGRACPMIITKRWTFDFIRFFARSTLGFTPNWGQFPFRDAAELVRLRFVAEIDPEFCREKYPGFDKMRCPQSCLKWNKKIFKARAHLDPPCPQNFVHPCCACPIGYDQCIAGVHRGTYEWKVCTKCNEENYHDPASSAGICIECVNRATNLV